MAAWVHFDEKGDWGETLVCEQMVTEALHRHGLAFGRVPIHKVGAGLDAALKAYAGELSQLQTQLAVRSIDRVAMNPADPEWPRLRRRFLAEHTHAEPEIRLFLAGTGLFYVRDRQGFTGVLCEAGDWISVPAGTAHFFDGGTEPDFNVLRLFGSPDGWAAQPTDAPVPHLPLLDEFREHLITLGGCALDTAE